MTRTRAATEPAVLSEPNENRLGPEQADLFDEYSPLNILRIGKLHLPIPQRCSLIEISGRKAGNFFNDWMLTRKRQQAKPCNDLLMNQLKLGESNNTPNVFY